MLRLFNTANFRLSALCGVVFACCFAIFLFFTYWTTTNVLEQQLRARVRDELNAFVTEAKTDGTQTVVQDIIERLNNAATTLAFYSLNDAPNQKLVGNIPNFQEQLGWQKIIPTADTDITGAQDEDHQIWGQGERLADGSFIFVGQDAYRVLAAQEAIIDSFFWLAGLATVLALLAGIIVSRKFLGRIDDINKTSLAIINGNLKERIPMRGTSDEIDKLSANLNRLLDSNQDLLDSLKHVSTNIAHDLRTPLSRLRQRLEDAQSTAKSAAEFRSHISSALNDSDQLLSTFSALLRISQIESGSRKSAFSRLDLSQLCERVTNIYLAVVEDSDRKLLRDIEPSIIVLGDEELLLQMLVNLLENAICHTPGGTTITLKLDLEKHHALLSISDNGLGIPDKQRLKVLDRFYRLEESRTTPGNGLGLSLVSAIAQLHNSVIELEDNAPGLRVSLSLPSIET